VVGGLGSVGKASSFANFGLCVGLCGLQMCLLCGGRNYFFKCGGKIFKTFELACVRLQRNCLFVANVDVGTVALRLPVTVGKLARERHFSTKVE